MAISSTRPCAREHTHCRAPVNQWRSRNAICLSYRGAASSHTRLCRSAVMTPTLPAGGKTRPPRRHGPPAPEHGGMQTFFVGGVGGGPRGGGGPGRGGGGGPGGGGGRGG